MAIFRVTTNIDNETVEGSLRKAVADANANAGTDTIVFSGVNLLRLTRGELSISDDLIVDGGDAGIVITADAANNDLTTGTGLDVVSDTGGTSAANLTDNSRIFNAGPYGGALTLQNLTLTGGYTSGDFNSGGAVVGSQSGVTLIDTQIIGNSTNGQRAVGGGVFGFGDVTLTSSVIRGNETKGFDADGGGVFAFGAVTITNSQIQNNRTKTDLSSGGGIYGLGEVTITGGSVTGNVTEAFGSGGGGVSSKSNITVTGALIGGNSTNGYYAGGGGLSSDAFVTVTNTQFYANATHGYKSTGGAIFGNGGVSLTNVTATGNYTDGAKSPGGAIFAGPFSPSDGYSTGVLTIRDSIILGNDALGVDKRDDAEAATISKLGGNIINGNVYSGDTLIGQTSAADVFNGATTNSQGRTFGIPYFSGGVYQGAVILRQSLDNPAIDAGSRTGDDALGLPGAVDVQGVSNGGVSDLGAFELQDSTVFLPMIDAPATVAVAENTVAVVDVDVAPDPTAEIDGSTITISGEDAALFNVDAATGVITFKSAPDFETPMDADGDNVHNITITATDPDNLSSTQSLTITVTDVDEAPVAAASSASGVQGRPIAGALSALDSDGDSLVFTVVDGPTSGVVSIGADGRFIYTPTSDFIGADSFTFRASDGALSDTATVSLLVNKATPTAGDDFLIGTQQNDRISALAGNDTVIGLDGDDSIRGGGGDDRLRGNRGDDTVKGNGGDDNINANGGADLIRGNGGEDTIRAGGGADDVHGGGGADVINGGGGADMLSGGGGRDTIAGKGGDDVLKGNGGADIFQFRASDRNDTILDFRQGQDKIEIQSGANAFDALSIDQDGADVLIGFGNGQVRVVTDSAAAFDASDFIF